MLAPPKPPQHEELEALFREARARQRKRRLLAALVMAVVAGSAVAIASIVDAAESRTAPHAGPPGTGRSRNACGIRGVGIRLVAASGRTVYRQPGRWAHPNRGYRSTIRCSGSSVWAVFYDGGAGGGKDPFAVHSGDGGKPWRPVLPDSFDPWLGTWTLRGKTAYFVGWYLAAADRTLEPSSSLWVTKDGGRNFRKYSVPALLGYEPTAIRVVGDRVTISGHREVNGVTRTKSVGVVVS